jgi:hypothetical protein
MSKQRKKLSENSIFANNPFLEDLLEWRDSPEGKQSMAVSDALWILLEDVQLDAKQRKFIWPDAERLDLEHSVQRIQKQYPDFARDRIEEFLINWIEGGYAPENYDQAQLDELDRLAAQWVADHMRPSKATKKGKRTPHSVRRGKARSPSGRQTHPATFAPAGSNRSSRGDNETAEAFDVKGHVGDSASPQAATCSESPSRPRKS